MMWGMVGGECSLAQKRYRSRQLRSMIAYLVVLFTCTWLSKHEPKNSWVVYFFAVLSAIPVIVMLTGMGQYLREEKDEFLRMIMMRSLLVGTGALMGTIVVTDFLRVFTPVGILPAFVEFMIFFIGFGIAQVVQTLQNRVAKGEEPSA